MTQTIMTNGIQLAYDDQGSGAKTLILLHGLTANRHSFDGLIAHDLAEQYRVLRVDLRGRGESDKPAKGYHMRDHAADILGLIEALGLENVTLVGHSFGGLLSAYLSVHHPEAMQQIVLMDVGLEATYPEVLPKIKPSLDRLGTTVPSWDVYISAIKQSPYYADGFWGDDIEGYYRADVEMLADGSVRSRVYGAGIEEAVQHIISDDWKELFQSVPKRALLIHAPAPLSEGGSPILSDEGAQETARLIPDCQYVRVPGHHITMVFGENAPYVVDAIRKFVE